MAELTYVERRTVEKAFGMRTGYVLNFSDRTFREFIIDAVRLDIDDPKYFAGGTSKANRLRTFMQVESDALVGALVHALADEAGRIPEYAQQSDCLVECRALADRLQRGAVLDLDAITPKAPGAEFEALVRAIKDTIARGEPESAVDRLHTYMLKWMRQLVRSSDREKPLHSLMGEYVKQLRDDGMLGTLMCERILRSAISTLDAFNAVRNDQSLAHDNPLIDRCDAQLIVNQVATLVRYIDEVERRRNGAGL